MDDHHFRRQRRNDRLAWLGLGVLALAFWGNCLGGGKVPVAAVYQKQMLPWAATAAAGGQTRQWDSLLWDSMAQFYPWRLLLHRAAQSDQLPLWNPYQFCGYPLVGNGQSAMFYPLNWLYFVVHPKIGLGLSAALHFFLGGLFVFGLARSWRLSCGPALFAALAFSYGGFMVTWIELPTLPNSLIWLPLAWWGIEVVCRAEGPAISRPAVHGLLMLALALGMTLLAGHFQIAAYVWIFAFLYAVIRLLPSRARIAPRCAFAFVLGLMLAMAQILPTLELAGYSSRGAGGPSAAGFEFHRQRALQPVELLTLLTPDFLGSPVTGDYPGISYSEHCGFVGAVTLLLGLAGLILKPRRGLAWLFGGLGLFALWGAMAGPPAMLLYWGVPKLGQAGGFARLLSVWTLAAALWGAVGLQAIIESMRGGGAVVGRGLVPRRPFASAGRPALRRSAPEPDASASGEGTPLHLTTGEEEGGAADRGLKPPAGGNRPADGRLSAAVATVALVLLLAQVLPWAYRFNPRARAEDVYPETELIRQLRARLGSDRYVAVNDRKAWGLTKVPANVILPPNAATVYGLRCVDGYDSLFPLSYRQFAAQVEGADPSPLANGNMLLLGNARDWARGAADVVVAADGTALPNVFATWWQGESCCIVVPSLRQARASVRERSARQSQSLTVTRDPLDAIRLELPALREESLVTIREALDADWLAFVDGHGPGAHLTSPGQARILSVPPTARHVDLVYFPASVACGLFVSLLALAAMAGLAAYGKAGRGR